MTYGSNNFLRIGIDVGGTKIEAIALDDAGQTLARRRVETPRGDYARTVDAIVSLIAEIDRDSGVFGTVGIGIPGAVTPAGVIKNANSTWLIGRALGADLEHKLGRPVRLMNDANCFALSEATDGAATDASSVFGVILGTGVGGGIVFDRHCHTGANLIGGEWGHNPLPWPNADELPGPDCYCGKQGCIETWCSGPGFANDHQRVTGVALETRAIVQAAADGNADAGATLNRYYDRLARALASVINVLDPDTIVLGGGMSNISGIAEEITKRVPKWVFSDTVVTRIVRHVHGDSSGVRGAAWLWAPNERV